MSPVPAQMWQRRAQSRRRCGSGERSPGARGPPATGANSGIPLNRGGKPSAPGSLRDLDPPTESATPSDTSASASASGTPGRATASASAALASNAESADLWARHVKIEAMVMALIAKRFGAARGAAGIRTSHESSSCVAATDRDMHAPALGAADADAVDGDVAGSGAESDAGALLGLLEQHDEAGPLDEQECVRSAIRRLSEVAGKTAIQLCGASPGEELRGLSPLRQAAQARAAAAGSSSLESMPISDSAAGTVFLLTRLLSKG